jgi:hypothetical protein
MAEVAVVATVELPLAAMAELAAHQAL